ncbi:MAG TPA: cobalt-precorrin-7 (C(5))-methyltransferase [Candidatus Bathyarchaeia archaeon]|nr:cobalt-precorrin-7 (C(5))-methyltransferase [Candidatus Bathyarchaeia archaeon]
MKIVGVGAGPGMLTQEAIEAIRGAKRVYGSPRALALAQAHIHGESIVLENYNMNLEDDACILSTGDPTLSGLGKKAPPGAKIIPGISSLQLACARLNLEAAYVVVVTTHGEQPTRAKEMLLEGIHLGRALFVLADPKFDLADICAYLDTLGYEGEVVILEDLAYKTERISYGRIAAPPRRQSPLFCAVINHLKQKRSAPTTR